MSMTPLEIHLEKDAQLVTHRHTCQLTGSNKLNQISFETKSWAS